MVKIKQEVKVGYWVEPTKNVPKYLTLGKAYEVIFQSGQLFDIIDDGEEKISCTFPICAHLLTSKGEWVRVPKPRTKKGDK